MGGKAGRRAHGEKLRTELLVAVFGSPLLHTWMGARIDEETTCSDASMTGGAVAVSRNLTEAGRTFLTSQDGSLKATEIPVVLVSLFNGIGGASRCYDIAGAKVKGVIFADIHKPANRVYNKRWPGGYGFGDVRDLGGKALEDCLMELEPLEEVHLWVGFPCVDLSSVRAGRRNLDGPSSGLIHEALRVRREIKELFPGIRLRHVFENVASMDVEARDQISELVGEIPYRLDPSAQVPMSRPRFCWTDVEIFETDEICLTEEPGYVRMDVAGSWPAANTWLDEKSTQMDPTTIYPTCMKSIPRAAPPSRPAGLERTSAEAQERWFSDDYRYPPYQYKDQYLIFDERLGRCRLLNSLERERLMGYGSHHTFLALSASEAKSNKTRFEDERCSLLGDGFSIYSFMVIAAFAAFPWLKRVEVQQMNNRTGLPPGMSLHLNQHFPLMAEIEASPLQHPQVWTVDALNKQLLRRTQSYRL